MSIFVLLLLGSLAIVLGLLVVLAFTRAVLYANVLTELDGAHEIQRRLRLHRRAQPASSGNAGRERDDPLERIDDALSPTANGAAKRVRAHGTVQSALPV